MRRHVSRVVAGGIVVGLGLLVGSPGARAQTPPARTTSHVAQRHPRATCDVTDQSLGLDPTRVKCPGAAAANAAVGAATTTPDTTPDGTAAAASATAQATPPLDLGPTVPGGPESFIPTIAAEPSQLKIVLVDYALRPTPVDYREPVTLIGQDEGPACQYRLELSSDQARTLFTTGELELTLPARCRLVELAFRQRVMVPTPECPPGVELCKREEIIDVTTYLVLEGSEYRSGSLQGVGVPEGLPSGLGLPGTGTSSTTRGTEGEYTWLTASALALVALGVIGLRVRRR